MTGHQYLLLDEAFEGLEGRCLFYPSAGADRDVPVEAFLPWIDDFWFVDIAYRLDAPFGPRTLLEDVRMEEFTGTTIRTETPYCVSVRHERYRRPGGGSFNIHACRGRGYDTLRAVFGAAGRKVSVFFHRGDSPGEGGSNFYWLRRKRLRNVLLHLESGGIIVSDGSNAMKQFRKSSSGLKPSDPISSVQPFEIAAHKFVCVGYLGERNGPTLAWKTSEA